MTTLADPPRTVSHRDEVTPDAQDPRDPAPSVDVDVPRKVGGITVDDVASAFGSMLAAVTLVWVLYEHVLLWSGVLGFLVSSWVVYLVLYAAVSALSNNGPAIRDRLVAAVVMSAALLVVFALGSAIWYTFLQGRHAVVHLNFYTQDMSGVMPSDPLTKGGISHALTGTAIEVAIATAIALPLGLCTAVYLTEVGGRLATVVRTVVEAMTALPDILAGLFVYVVFIIYFGWDKTGLAVAIALAVTMTPVIARSSEVVLRVVPSGLREAGLALGASKWRTVWNVVLPTARSGTATSLILGIARVAGETAPLLIVSGSSTFFNANPINNPMNSLPLFIYAAIKSGQSGPPAERAYGAALVLLAFVLILFVAARFFARDKAGKR